MKKSLSVVLAFALTFVLAACGGGNNEGAPSGSASPSKASESSAKPAEKVTIEYWHTYSDSEEKVLLEKIKPKFETEHPNIELKLTRMPYEGLKDQVIAAVAGDAAPDLMRMDIIWVPELASKGALKKLSDLPGFDDVKSAVFDSPMQTNIFKGEYYGVPLNTNTKVAIYNADTLKEAGLDQAPATMDELVQAARNLKSQGKQGIGVSSIGAWGVLPYFWSLGGKVTNDDYTQVDGYLNSPASIEALETIVSWNNEGLVIPALLGGEPGSWDGLKSGQYMMIDDGPWFFSILLGDAENTFNPLDKTVRAQLPAGPGGSISVVGGENLVSFANSKHPEEAWTFMKWMLGKEPQQIMVEAGMVPTNREAAQAIDPGQNPYIGTFIEQLNTALPRTPIPQWGEMETIFNLSLEKAIRGDQTAADALNEAVKQINAILAK
ncbi:ABC transporter substrate-binding protein [Cohnella sp. CIP 111063]|uniref:extracellular solute-binding protein n=1 Tax=unclassified Cohnella TaxID=2636738 RepID=UPI000B8BF5DD|nr:MULTISPECIES: extracellular solute-binding protein [unclassified Cohnella]OXS62712.1 ABC transporter substrate-binding protein [Cohnella sp. CIP 111063]PRX74980.1 carbohydrate ABC transporter substrate-binding protein (CUT1 family) [Cohnella sp. SGD-V74]